MGDPETRARMRNAGFIVRPDGPEALADRVARGFVLALALGVLEHQLFLTRMGTGWKLLYEFGAYYRALRELAAAVTRWQQALEQRSALEGANFDQVELLAWRTLGEGLLLVDMYRQGVRDLNELPEASPGLGSIWRRARSWLRRLR